MSFRVARAPPSLVLRAYGTIVSLLLAGEEGGTQFYLVVLTESLQYMRGAQEFSSFLSERLGNVRAVWHRAVCYQSRNTLVQYAF
jgi:hypothetical protein